jgi:hypothetical protein
MTSRELVDFVENKLKQHDIQKVMPDRETLARTYQLFAASNRLSEAFDEVKEELEEEREQASINVPDDLEANVTAKLQEQPDIPWHRAVQLILDPNAEVDDDEEDDGEQDDDEDDLDVDE